MKNDYSEANMAKAIQSDQEVRFVRWLGSFVTVVIVVFLSCCTYYCSQPSQQTASEKLQADCQAKGGTWMPVETVSYREISCVSKEALPTITNMNIEAAKKQSN